MSRLHRLIALVLLALWVPATTHCGWEVSLDVAAADCCGGHDHDAAHGDAEHCVVESGEYFANQASVSVTAPDLLVCWCGDIVRITPPESMLPVAHVGAEAPPELPRTWQFVARTALPARAPSIVS